MAMVTVGGIYEDGKIELAERPQGVTRARVQVTFFTDAAGDEGPGGAEQQFYSGPSPRQDAAPAVAERYPAELREEYQTLILKKLHRTLTAEEAARLDAARDEINWRDRQSTTWSLREARAREVEQQLTDMRQELESLPDA